MRLFKSFRVLNIFLCTTIGLFAPILASAASGPLVLYTFDEGKGSIVHDVSGNGSPLDLRISDVENTHWLLEGGLSVDQPVSIAASGSPDKIVNSIKKTNAITIEAWIQPTQVTQSGPARIATLSNGRKKRNFTLGQDNASYDVRLRTTGTNGNGTPSISSANNTLNTKLTHVVYTRNARGRAKIYINGVRKSRTTVSGDLGNWSNRFNFALANETSGDRPWLGKLYQVAIYDRALSATAVDAKFAQGAYRESPANTAVDTGTSNETASSESTGGTAESGTDSTGSTDSSSTESDTGTTDTTSQLGVTTLSWLAPVARSNGTPLSMSEISGYTLYYGESAGDFSKSITINDAYTTSVTVTDLPLGKYYFVVTAYDTDGLESTYSSTSIKTVD